MPSGGMWYTLWGEHAVSNPSLTPHDMCRRPALWVAVGDSVSHVVTVTVGGDTDIGRQWLALGVAVTVGDRGEAQWVTVGHSDSG